MTLYEQLTAIGAIVSPIVGVLTAFYLVQIDKRKERKKENKRVSLVRKSILEATKNLCKAIDAQGQLTNTYLDKIEENECNIYKFPLVVALKPIRFKEYLQTDIYKILTNLEKDQNDETHGLYNNFMTSIDAIDYKFNSMSELRNSTISKHNENLRTLNEVNGKMFNIVLKARVSTLQTDLEQNKNAILLYQNQVKKIRPAEYSDFKFFNETFVLPILQNKEEFVKKPLGFELFVLAVEGRNVVEKEADLVNSTVELLDGTLLELNDLKTILNKTIEKLEAF